MLHSGKKRFLVLWVFIPSLIFAQEQGISLHVRDASLNEVMNQIEKQCQYTFLLNEESIDANQQFTADLNQVSLNTALKTLFANRNISYTIEGRQIILKSSDKNGTEQKGTGITIEGRVTDGSTGMEMSGVNVRINGSSKGTVTDANGNYVLELNEPGMQVVFSYLGYAPAEQVVTGPGRLDVSLQEQSTMLESVVVTALGIQRELRSLGYAVEQVSPSSMQTIRMASPTVNLTGKISGLLIRNSTNFGTDPIVSLRGENPLLVIDGVPSDNLSLEDISPDDIRSIDVLKGASASALYGYRGSHGAIMITTQRGSKEKGFSVSLNLSGMMNLGFVALPETQKSYSSGYNGHYGNDYVWGDKLDIGRTATLWDPMSMSWKPSSPLVSVGKNNLENFQRTGFITNNNISIANQTDRGSLRTSVSWVMNKGQFPNQKQNRVSYSLGGTTRVNKLSLESNITYSKSLSPNIHGNQYSGGYLYNIIGWLGSEWDIRDYRNYWMVPDEKQNWFNEEWYDNPYFLAYQVTESADRDKLNGFLSATYTMTSWLKLSLRSGFDDYFERYDSRNPMSARNAWNYFGYFRDEKYSGYSTNNDLLLSFEKNLGDFSLEGLAGGTLFFSRDDYFNAYTRGGLEIPGFYSLSASVDPIGWNNSLKRKQVNSLYSRAALSYRKFIFLDLTGRNDWSSTLSPDTRSYFYPSVSGSLLLSEFLKRLSWLDAWKVRTSWTMSKTPAGVYDINHAFIIQNEVWGGFNGAYYPTEIKGHEVRPQTSQTWEYGTAYSLFGSRLKMDLTWYRKRIYDFLASAQVSDATGFTAKFVNTREVHLKKGTELIAGITPILRNNWKWIININWSKDETIYEQLDPQYSPDQPWVKPGKRVDAYTVYDWERNTEGQLINQNGFPVRSLYKSVAGYSNPDWIWGLNTTLKYKQVSLSCSWDGRVGGVSFSRLDALLWNSGAHAGTDNPWRYDEVVNGKISYVGPGVKVVSGSVVYDTYGKIISDTRVYAPNDVAVSYEGYMRSHYALGAWSYCRQDILDETFLKLREVSITFQIPPAWIQKLKMKNMDFSVTGQNLFFRGKEYKYADPDFGETLDLVSPSIRYVGMDLKAEF